MTREELKALLPDASDDVITTFLNKHNGELASVKKNNVPEEELKEMREKAKKFDDYEKDKLSAEEKIQLALKEAETTRVANLKLLNRTKAIAEFTKSGLSEKDYEAFIDTIVTDNEDITITSAKAICETLKSQKETLEQKLKDEYLKGINKPQGGNKPDNEDTLTNAEQIAKTLATASATTEKSAQDAMKNYIGGKE